MDSPTIVETTTGAATTTTNDGTVLPLSTMTTMLRTADEDTLECLAERIQQLTDLAKWFNGPGRRIIRKLPRSRTSVSNAGSASSRRNSADSLKKPVPLRDSLAAFMGLPPGSSAPRPDVTKFITAYIRENDLQIEGNRKSFAFDEPLAAAFGVEVGTTSNYFEMQKLLNAVIIKTGGKKTGTTAREDVEDSATQTDAGGGDDDSKTPTTTPPPSTATPTETSADATTATTPARKTTTAATRKKATKASTEGAPASKKAKKSVAAATTTTTTADRWADADDDDDVVDGSGGGCADAVGVYGDGDDDEMMNQLARDLNSDGDDEPFHDDDGLGVVPPPAPVARPVASSSSSNKKNVSGGGAPKRKVKGLADLVGDA